MLALFVTVAPVRPRLPPLRSAFEKTILLLPRNEVLSLGAVDFRRSLRTANERRFACHCKTDARNDKTRARSTANFRWRFLTHHTLKAKAQALCSL